MSGLADRIRTTGKRSAESLRQGTGPPSTIEPRAAAVSALVETANSYRFYFAVYVRRVSRFTPVYMAPIDPFRKLVVYPSLLRTVCSNWNQTFGTA